MRAHVDLMRVNKIKAMHGRSRVHVKVEPRSTITFTVGLLCLYFINGGKIFERSNVKITRQWKSITGTDL